MVLIVDYVHLIAEMGFVTVCMNHVVLVPMIVVHVYHRIVGMGLVTVMNHVETVLMIVDHVQILVEMEFAIVQQNHVVHVLMIVDRVQTLVEMDTVILQQNRAALVPVIVAHAHQPSFVEMGHVILEKIVKYAQAIVEHAHQLVLRLTNMDLWQEVSVSWKYLERLENVDV